MKKNFTLPLMVILAVSLISAQGFSELNVAVNGATPSARCNLSSNATMLNLNFSLYPENTSVKITSINFTFNSTGSIAGNVSNLSVCVYNETLGNLVACNSSWDTNITTLPIGYNVTNTTNLTLLVLFNISSTSYYPMNVSLGILSNASIILDNASITVSSASFPLSSNWTEVKYVKASANISPTYVDTNVTNQTFRYSIFSTTGDTFERINITLPSGYTITNVTNYSIIRFNNAADSPILCDNSTNCSVSANHILINYTPGIKNITVYFTANTSASQVINLAFNSTITAINLLTNSTNMGGATNVTTTGLINVTNITIVKNSAAASGSDYWEFNLTVNTSANVSGLVQFKMNNWTSSLTGANISLVNGTTYYANLRDSSNTTSQNVTNDYQITNGVSLTAVAGTLYNLTLRMIIPSGTVPAADWITSYKILFRSQP